MKLFLKKRLTFILLFFLFLMVVQLLLVYLSMDESRSFTEVRYEVLMIILVFIIIQFTLSIFFIARFPYTLKKYLKSLDDLISEISGGSYNVNIDLKEQHQKRDKELVHSISLLKDMLGIVLKFDSLKKQKIQEQRTRIIALLNLTENGFIIINRKGDVIYVNHVINDYFPIIKEDMNIIESSFTQDIDKNIKSYITEIVRTKSHIMPKKLFMPTVKKHITIKNEIIRDTNGDFDGTVIGIFNLEKKQTDEDKPDNGKIKD